MKSTIITIFVVDMGVGHDYGCDSRECLSEAVVELQHRSGVFESRRFNACPRHLSQLAGNLVANFAQAPFP
jgi:hypothetical protein